MPEEAAISGIDDASQVRVRLLQSGRAVHAPVLSIGLQPAGSYQPLDADLTSWALITRASGFDTFATTPSSANLAALITDELGANQLLFGTPWVTYTPTFTGFGTATSVSIWSRRLGDTLHIRGRFTAGTPTGVEARMTLGFNGTNGGITSDATKVPNLQQAGTAIITINSASSWYTLIESNIGYITFGVQNATNAGYVKALGTTVSGVNSTIGIMAEIPISGW